MMLMKRQIGVVGRMGARCESTLVDMKKVLTPGTVGALRDIRDLPGKKVFYFSNKWHPMCKQMTPIVREWSLTHPDITWIKVEFEEHGSFAAEYGVKLVPTFLFMNDTGVKDKYTGSSDYDLAKLIKGLKTGDKVDLHIWPDTTPLF